MGSDKLSIYSWLTGTAHMQGKEEGGGTGRQESSVRSKSQGDLRTGGNSECPLQYQRGENLLPKTHKEENTANTNRPKNDLKTAEPPTPEEERTTQRRVRWQK